MKAKIERLLCELEVKDMELKSRPDRWLSGYEKGHYEGEKYMLYNVLLELRKLMVPPKEGIQKGKVVSYKTPHPQQILKDKDEQEKWHRRHK